MFLQGDHQQLRPSVNVHELETKYHLDVSLFERLIEVGMEPNVLGVQHRMRPEVARLISPAIYPDLKNAQTVQNRPSIPGMQRDVITFCHISFRGFISLLFRYFSFIMSTPRRETEAATLTSTKLKWLSVWLPTSSTREFQKRRSPF